MRPKLKIKEAVVVEGRYDGHLLRSVTDGFVLELSGFAAFKNKKLLAALETLAKGDGLIVLTDSDGAGLQLRNLIRGSVSGNVKHAYIPEIPGRERRKKKPGAAGLLGVEGMEGEVIVRALLAAGATVVGEGADGAPAPGEDGTPARAGDRSGGGAEPLIPVTRQELFEDGLLGGPGSGRLRKALCERLGIPALSVSALAEFLSRALGLCAYREELAKIKEEIRKREGKTN